MHILNFLKINKMINNLIIQVIDTGKKIAMGGAVVHDYFVHVTLLYVRCNYCMVSNM